MKDWLPFFEQLVWPIFWAAVILCAWGPLRRLLRAIEERIAAGAEFEAGAKGIRVGAPPKLAEVPAVSATSRVVDEAKAAGTPKPSDFYLVHTVRRDRSLDKGDLRYFRVRIYLDADDPGRLDQVSEVTYYLHETFAEPVRVVRDRQTAFEVQTIVWGEFNVAALVRFGDGSDVKLERYLNL